MGGSRSGAGFRTGKLQNTREMDGITVDQVQVQGLEEVTTTVHVGFSKYVREV